MEAKPAVPPRTNNFNLIRLLLATLVILCHSPELTDGNRNREILTVFFGPVSFGELAVNGFFVLSGFLIVQSWLREPDVRVYFRKRVLRIYPAFLTSLLVCALGIVPLVGGVRCLAQFDVSAFTRDALLLQLPVFPPIFQGTPNPEVNGSLYTISYEFRCYTLIALLGLCGVFRQRRRWLMLTLVSLVLLIFPGVTVRLHDLLLSCPPGFHLRGAVNHFYGLMIGDPLEMTRFWAFFRVGVCFFLFHDRIRYDRRLMALAAVALIPCLYHVETMRIGMAAFGAYLVMSLAFAQSPSLARLRTLPDVSYGVYLYAWPLQKLLLWYVPALSPWALFAFVTPLCLGCGWLSWHGIEQPFLRLKPRQHRQPPQCRPSHLLPTSINK